MTNTTTVCDLCPASTPIETSFANGFTKINVQGEGPVKLRPLLGKNDNHVDFCQHCFDAFLAWAENRKAGHAVVAVAALAPAPTPAPVVDAPPVTEPTAEHVAEPTVEPAPAAHEEAHA